MANRVWRNVVRTYDGDCKPGRASNQIDALFDMRLGVHLCFSGISIVCGIESQLPRQNAGRYYRFGRRTQFKKSTSTLRNDQPDYGDDITPMIGHHESHSLTICNCYDELFLVFQAKDDNARQYRVDHQAILSSHIISSNVALVFIMHEVLYTM